MRSPLERVLYDFQAGNDGASPQGTLIADSAGSLYGTTTFGGGTGCFEGCGTVFKLTKHRSAYTESILYRFPGGTDGNGPGSGVIADASGALYGTTEYGGDTAGNGTVFKLTPHGSTYAESVLYRFKGGMDGNGPLAGLTMDRAGNLYGATLLGDNAPGCGTSRSGVNGCGIIFELRRSRSTYSERILHRFQSGYDGATPGSPPIFVGHDMYGTAATGGGNPSCGGAPINRGCGTIYRLTRRANGSWSFGTVYDFQGAPHDAANPFAGLVVDKNGRLYGVGQYGGTANQGSAFWVLSGSSPLERMIHSFTGHDGSYPTSALAVGKRGRLYGTSEYGGNPSNSGVVFAMTPSGSESLLLGFSEYNGAYPIGGVLVGSDGALFGTASYGGNATAAAGVVFRL